MNAITHSDHHADEDLTMRLAHASEGAVVDTASNGETMSALSIPDVRRTLGEELVTYASNIASTRNDSANDASTTWARVANAADALAAQSSQTLTITLLLRVVLMKQYPTQVKLEAIRNIVRGEDASQPNLSIQADENEVAKLMAELRTARTHFSTCVCDRCKAMRTRDVTSSKAARASVWVRDLRRHHTFNPRPTNNATKMAFQRAARARKIQEGPGGKRHTTRKIYYARQHSAILPTSEKILDEDGGSVCLRVCLCVSACMCACACTCVCACIHG
jgi:hypothetical protein